jgi:crotonobetainyl-CoA:carnitine CoA-transferase CaiB-like acyl-CoA transferase
MKGPLNGIRVLEFAQIAAGPFAGSLFADLGADVVKVERPDGGDGMRTWPPAVNGERGDPVSGNFTSVNRNKRSITVDVKNPGEMKRFYELVASTDLFVENYRPGVPKRLGMGYEELRKHNPRLVYCSISGYGQTGPYAQKGAFDVTVQAISGVMSVTGEEDGPPVKCGVPLGDFGAGLYAAFTSLAAIMKARETGQGAYIDCSMLGSLLGFAALQTSEFFGTGVAPKRLGSAHPRNAPYQGYDAKDRPFTVAAGNDKLWRDFCEVIGRMELPDEARFKSQFDRARNQKELLAIVQPIFLTKSADEWVAALDAKGIPCAVVLDYSEILSNEHVKDMGLVRSIALSNGATTKTVGFPIKISNFTYEIDRAPPGLGEHNQEVYKEWTKSAKTA